tara:strand:- start:204 stop:377 length:174 start_codon:yes stop_codon:yes gene_type:complete
MDEALNQLLAKSQLAASMTDVPIAAAIIIQVAPLLGLEPNEKLNEKKWDCPISKMSS